MRGKQATGQQGWYVETMYMGISCFDGHEMTPSGNMKDGVAGSPRFIEVDVLSS